MRYIFFTILILILNGCGSGEINSTVDTEGNLELYMNKSLIDKEHKEFYMEFYVKNGYVDDIGVELYNMASRFKLMPN